MSIPIAATISKALRNTRFGSWLLDEFPVRIRGGSGRPMTVTRRAERLLKQFKLDSAEAAMVLRHYDGGSFLDVGAHHGAYCFLLAGSSRPGCTFAAFEPAPVCYPFLIHNLATLSDAYPSVRFVPIPLPVGNGSRCEFTFPMGESYHPRVISREELISSDGGRAISIDEAVTFLGIKPSFVKIDVEGAEVFVVEGMKTLLRAYHPVVMLEFHPLFQPSADSPEKICGYLDRAGYRMVEEVDSKVARQQIWKFFRLT